MLGIILEVMVILPYPPQLQEEHKDPYVLDQDNNIMQESLENVYWFHNDFHIYIIDLTQ